MWTAEGTIADSLDPQRIKYIDPDFVDAARQLQAGLGLSRYRIDFDEQIPTSEITSTSFALVPLFLEKAAEKRRGEKVKCGFHENDALICIVDQIYEPAL